jgi:hypothetical protein
MPAHIIPVIPLSLMAVTVVFRILRKPQLHKQWPGRACRKVFFRESFFYLSVLFSPFNSLKAHNLNAKLS